jgi:hypothetical protein
MHKEQFERAFDFLSDVWPAKAGQLPLETMLLIAEIMSTFARLEVARKWRTQTHHASAPVSR